MNTYLKYAALGLVVVLALILGFNIFSNPHNQEDDSQKNIVEQQKTYQNQLKEAEAQLERSKRFYETAEVLQKRNEKLIEKWEEQAKRIDTIISRLEKSK